MYIANEVHAPLFTDKGEFHIAGSLGTSGVNTHIAYALTPHIGVMANGATINWGSGEESGHNSYIDAGAGYFCPIGSNLIFETYGGIGKGNVTDLYYDNKSFSDTKLCFLQPSIGTELGKIKIGISGRMMLAESRYHRLGVDTDIKDNVIWFAVQPAVNFTTGSRIFRTTFQAGLLLTNQNDICPLYLSMGFLFDIDYFFK